MGVAYLLEKKIHIHCLARESCFGQYKDYFVSCAISSYSNDCAADDELSERFSKLRMRDNNKIVCTSIQQIKVSLSKRVKFKLEGSIPTDNEGLHNFKTPELPNPGETIDRNNAPRPWRRPRFGGW